MSILNKESTKQLDTIKSILFKKKIAQSILSIATILRVTSLRKEFVLKIEISSSILFARSLINNLIINQLTKFVLFKLCVSYINLFVRKKLAKTRQKIV